MASSRSKTVKPKRRRSIPSGKTATESRPLKIGEAARLLGVEAYVLRFWETQFPFLRPRHTASSHRMYAPENIESLKMVKRLLHVEGFTIAGAKRHIREVGLARLRAPEADPAPSATTAPEPSPTTGNSGYPDLRQTLNAIRIDLQSLYDSLKN
jgi:DNA-binding transcriptional MerR regulator